MSGSGRPPFVVCRCITRPSVPAVVVAPPDEHPTVVGPAIIQPARATTHLDQLGIQRHREVHANPKTRGVPPNLQTLDGNEVNVGLGSLGFGLGFFGRNQSKLVAFECWQCVFPEGQPDWVGTGGNSFRAPQKAIIRNVFRGDRRRSCVTASSASDLDPAAIALAAQRNPRDLSMARGFDPLRTADTTGTPRWRPW